MDEEEDALFDFWDNPAVYDSGAGGPVIDAPGGGDASFECAAMSVGAEWKNDLAAGGCPACGAELYGGKSTIAAVCPCCGNAQIAKNYRPVDGIPKPDYIIPFKRGKEAAEMWMKDFCEEGKRLLPDDFMNKNRIEGGFRGIYAPYWLFDAKAEGSIGYSARIIRGSGRHSHADTYSVAREGNAAFAKIPVGNSAKMEDGYMDAIEPFNYAELEAFHPSFLAGCAAEKGGASVEECKPRAERRMKETIEDRFMSTVQGYDEVDVKRCDINVKWGTVSSALFPVWALNAKHNGKSYRFIMNGQTGIFVGKLPVDVGKMLKYWALFTGIFCAAAAASLLTLGFLANAKIFKMLSIGATFTEAMRASKALANDDTGAINIILLILAFISLIASVFGGYRIVLRWKRKMNTVRRDPGAFDFVAPGGINYTKMTDRMR